MSFISIGQQYCDVDDDVHSFLYETDIKIEWTKAQTDLRNKIIKNKRFNSFIVLHCAPHNRIS